MKRVLLDTNLYISFMNTGAGEALVLGPAMIRYMSTVVLMELEAGATTTAARRSVAQLARTFEKTGRLSAPSSAVWSRAGSVLRALRAQGREVRRASLVHDVLIALTARDIGATVLTQDAGDYAAIRKYVDFSYSAVL
jgi:predicted nucleic acid-binding protein